MLRAFALLLGLSALVAALAAANWTRESGSLAPDWRIVRVPPREVVAEAPGRGPIVQTIAAPGTVEPVEEADIASQLVGRVIAVNVKDGDAVKKGDILVKIDDTEPRARLDSARARIDRARSAIDQAEAEREKADRDLGRFGRLVGRGASTQTEVADARSLQVKAMALLEMSKHDLTESQAMERTSRQALDWTEIRSPIDGVVSGLEVEVGEVVIAGTTNLPGTVLMTVADLGRMQVRADVDESDVPLVKPGQPARVYLQADGDEALPGVVDRVSPKGKKSAEVVSFETLIRVEANGPTIRSGMTATVEVEVRRAPEALGVPVQAVVHRRRKDLPDTPAVRAWAEGHARSPGEKAREAEARYIPVVFVLDGGTARAVPVETGLTDERRIEIRSGLKPADRVIVGPFRALDELKEGDPVTLAPAQPVAAEGAKR